ncbi:type VII secretion protein EccB [Kitasatospora sp. NPDC101801]|uniref:type VII secretion protein EccB n=1 Tax=Kitasatospora sp. NPDC101801 TaxID=3364103 RepID=UPI003830B41C
MASRRDELNAYTAARKRTVGAFLLPSGGGNDEDAPRPVKAVLPSVVIGVVIVAGFAMWGVIKPAAPKGWDGGGNIIQGKQSTTRYVILPGDKGAKVLHQVLNMSSARLVLPANAKVVIVEDKVLDAYPNHGATIGIPYAPDKLPKAEVAGQTDKKWSVCNSPGAEEKAPPNQAVFVAAGKDATRLADPKLMLGAGESMYVQAPLDTAGLQSTFMVDRTGTRHLIGNATSQPNEKALIAGSLYGSDMANKPQRVTEDWLQTLATGEPIGFQTPPGFVKDKPVSSKLDQLAKPEERKVGRLLNYDKSYFMVGVDKLYSVSPFQAKLALSNPDLPKAAYGGAPAKLYQLSAGEYAALSSVVEPLNDAADIPDEMPTGKAVNHEGRNRLCSTFEGMDGTKIKRSVWAGAEYPAPVDAGASSARVSPGHGLLFRAMDSNDPASSGRNYLITETGLRYPVPTNNDGGKAGASAAPKEPAAEQQPAGQEQQANENQARLGFDKVTPVPVPLLWAKLVPAGPVLSKNDALQPQLA